MKIYSKQTEEITLCVEEKTMLKKLSTHMLRQSSNRQYSSLARSSLSEAVLKSKTTTGRVTIYSTNPTRNVSYLPNSPVVVISYNDLVADNDISESLDKAFGKEGLGLITVSDIPNLLEVRQNLLPLARKFADMPDSVKNKYESEETQYQFGWSHGKEMLAEGKPDWYKGSYYNNPTANDPFASTPEEKAANPLLSHPNIWPSEEMPELEPAFLALGTTIVNTGMLVARQCDKLVHSRFPAYPPNKLYNIIKSSRINKARMLHYYAPDASEVSSNVSADDASASSSSSDATTDASSPSENDFSDWCGWHNDHGSLTGLACSMYIDADGNEISNPDPQAGLHIRSRSGEIIQATFPADHLAFQMGETQHVHSGGVLQATPHAVRASSVPGVTRETMAVFMEPEYEELMNLPEGANTDDVVVALANEHLPKGVPSLASRWKDSKQTFGDYHYTTIDAYYKQ